METIKTNHVHHFTLTVSNVRRSQQFYGDLLGFQFLTDFGPRVLMSNGSVILALTPAPEPARAIPNDRFDENRIGLDHISLSVAARADLDAAMRVLDANGISHGENEELTPFGITVLAFRDPDNIQVELTAPTS